MKKILLGVLIVFSCCSKDETTTTSTEENSFTIEYESPEIDFYGIPNKSLTNIQVGDMLKINFAISKLTSATEIELRPISKSTSYHELLNTDYELYIENTTKKGTFDKVNTLKMIKGVNIFYIKPIVSGTFQLKFEESSKAFTLLAPITFSAVKIATSIEGNRDGNCGLSRWRRHTYWFSIDTGNQNFDLIFGEEGATYTYRTSYRGSAKEDNFSKNTNFRIIEDVSECGDYPDVDNNITSIEIIKNKGGVSQVVAKYNDIYITD